MSLSNHSESDPTFTSQLTSQLESSEQNVSDYDSDDHLLVNSKNKLTFFTKIGLLSFINFGFYSLVCLMIIKLPTIAREYYWIYNIESMFYINIMMIIVMKCFISFVSTNLKKIGLILYGVDLFLSFRNILGLYFYFGNYLQNMYIYNGHYVILFCYILTANSLGYIFSTLYRRKDQQYNWKLGFWLMELSTFIVISLFRSAYSIMTMRLSKYIGVFIFFTFVNYYVAFDTFLMNNMRDKKFQESDYIFGYYSIWTDWFSFFWTDYYKYLYMKRKEGKLNKIQNDETNYVSDDEEEDVSDHLSQSFSEGMRNEV